MNTYKGTAKAFRLGNKLRQGDGMQVELFLDPNKKTVLSYYITQQAHIQHEDPEIICLGSLRSPVPTAYELSWMIYKAVTEPDQIIRYERRDY